MKTTSFLLFVLFVFAAAISFAKGDGEDFEVSVSEGFNGVTGNGIPINLQWRVDGANLNIQVTAQTTGWVAVGFNPSSKMKDANILIGYISQGEAFLRDDYGIAPVQHGPDTENGGTENYSNLSGSEKDGITQIRFTIPLDSGDDLDRALTPGKSYKVILALGPDDKDDFGMYHARRGSVEIEL